LAEIASLAGMSRRQLGRLLDGQKPLRLVDLKRLSAIVGIDAAKAVIAIEIIGDWSAYDEPVLEILIRMLAPFSRRWMPAPIFRWSLCQWRPRSSRPGLPTFWSPIRSRSDSAAMSS
jgi:transcriptional regulator with XRE-family HTH domain